MKTMTDRVAAIRPFWFQNLAAVRLAKIIKEGEA